LVHYPAKIRQGFVTDRPVSNMDVTATILDAAGVGVPDHFDSRSLLDFANGDAEWPEALVCEHNGHDCEILQRIVIKGGWKYTAALFDGDELYDLDNDPSELSNLVDDEQSLVKKRELQGTLVRHMDANDSKGESAKLLHRLRLETNGDAVS
jgi:arylsulfatase A-like enzyme